MSRGALLVLPALALAASASAQAPVAVPEAYRAPQRRDPELPPPPTRPVRGR